MLCGENFKYAPSKKLVSLSFILVFFSIFFAFQFFDFYFLVVYFLVVLIITLIMIKLKIWIYSRFNSSTDEIEKSFPYWPLALLVIIGLFLPFLLLFILDPVYILILINGYVAGINIPEIIFFLLNLKRKSKSYSYSIGK